MCRHQFCRYRFSAPLVVAFILALAGVCRAAEMAPPMSPWNAGFWRAVSPQTRQYICAHAKMRPGWCGTEYDFSVVYDQPEEEPYGPLLTADDARWLRMLDAKTPEDLTVADAAFIEKRARQTGDPDAMEVLGYLYARGIAVVRDVATAYTWYGRAFLRGQVLVKENMNLLWAELNEKDPESAKRVAKLFEKEIRDGMPGAGGRLTKSAGPQSRNPVKRESSGG